MGRTCRRGGRLGSSLVCRSLSAARAACSPTAREHGPWPCDYATASGTPSKPSCTSHRAPTTGSYTPTHKGHVGTGRRAKATAEQAAAAARLVVAQQRCDVLLTLSYPSSFVMYSSYSPRASLKKAREVRVSLRAWPIKASRICGGGGGGRQGGVGPGIGRGRAGAGHAGRRACCACSVDMPALLDSRSVAAAPTLGWQCPWLTAE